MARRRWSTSSSGKTPARAITASRCPRRGPCLRPCRRRSMLCHHVHGEQLPIHSIMVERPVRAYRASARETRREARMPEAMTGGPRRQIAAILFADVHGYSRLMSRNEERTYQRVTQALRLIRSLIGDYGGRVEHVAGDGVLALFESAAQALQFAIAIQREFRNDAVWNADDEPITFRIGINLGEVFFGGEAIQGHSVNVAARIQALALPGGIC